MILVSVAVGKKRQHCDVCPEETSQTCCNFVAYRGMLHSLIVSSNIWVLSSSVGFKELISEQLSQFTAILLKFLDSVLWNEEFKVKQAKSSGSSINLHLGKFGICCSCWSVLRLSCMAVLWSEECLLL